jgi:hypothetical protein
VSYNKLNLKDIENDLEIKKTCYVCRVEKVLQEFITDNNNEDPVCKDCRALISGCFNADKMNDLMSKC